MANTGKAKEIQGVESFTVTSVPLGKSKSSEPRVKSIITLIGSLPISPPQSSTLFPTATIDHGPSFFLIAPLHTGKDLVQRAQALKNQTVSNLLAANDNYQ